MQYKFLLILFLISLIRASYAKDIIDCKSKIPEAIDLTNYQALIEKIEAESFKSPELICDLSKLKKYPEVLLMGEKHWGSDDSDNVKKFIMDKAVEGKTNLLLEVIPDTGAPAGISATFPWIVKNPEFLSPKFISPHIGGIESLIPKSLMEASSMYKQLEEEKKYGKQLSLNSSILVTNVSINPVFKAALNRIAKRSSVSCQQCVELLNKASENDKFNNKDRYSTDWNTEIYNEMGKIPTQEYFSFVGELYEEIIKLLTPAIKKHLPDYNFSNKEFTHDQLERIAMDWRNEDFALTIANSLCSNSNSDNVLSVIVGDAHTKGVIANLKELSKDTVKIQYYKSYDGNDASMIFSKNFK